MLSSQVHALTLPSRFFPLSSFSTHLDQDDSYRSRQDRGPQRWSNVGRIALRPPPVVELTLPLRHVPSLAAGRRFRSPTRTLSPRSSSPRYPPRPLPPRCSPHSRSGSDALASATSTGWRALLRHIEQVYPLRRTPREGCPHRLWACCLVSRVSVSGGEGVGRCVGSFGRRTSDLWLSGVGWARRGGLGALPTLRRRRRGLSYQKDRRPTPGYCPRQISGTTSLLLAGIDYYFPLSLSHPNASK